MLDNDYLAKLIPILKYSGVASIKMQGLELMFRVEHGSNPEPHTEPSGKVDSTAPIIEAIKKQEEALPPDLRADHLMERDKILHWSSPQEDSELALTGESEL